MNTPIAPAVKVLPGSETILQSKAWKVTTPLIREAVRLLLLGDDLSNLSGYATLTAADAITLRRLGTKQQIFIVKKVDPQEKDAKPKSILNRIERVEGAARVGLKHGYQSVDAGSLADFLLSPMRAKILRIESPESAKRKREKAAQEFEVMAAAAVCAGLSTLGQAVDTTAEAAAREAAEKAAREFEVIAAAAAVCAGLSTLGQAVDTTAEAAAREAAEKAAREFEVIAAAAAVCAGLSTLSQAVDTTAESAAREAAAEQKRRTRRRLDHCSVWIVVSWLSELDSGSDDHRSKFTKVSYEQKLHGVFFSLKEANRRARKIKSEITGDDDDDEGGVAEEPFFYEDDEGTCDDGGINHIEVVQKEVEDATAQFHP